MTENIGSQSIAPRTITREDGATIAYYFTPGKSPGVVFFTGFMSDMNGSKALALEAFCRARGDAFLRFDYFGHGGSSGAFIDGTIGRWADDAVFVLDHLTDGPQVLVGSSMGGWCMLLAARARPERVAGMVGIAAAPDFTLDLLDRKLNAQQRAILERDGVVFLDGEYDPDPSPITKVFVEDGDRHLQLQGEIPLDCPVRLIHGMCDPDIPWQTSLKIAEKLRSTDVEISLVKSGEHRLSEPEDIARLTGILGRLLDDLAGAIPL